MANNLVPYDFLKCFYFFIYKWIIHANTPLPFNSHLINWICLQKIHVIWWPLTQRQGGVRDPGAWRLMLGSRWGQNNKRSTGAGQQGADGQRERIDWWLTEWHVMCCQKSAARSSAPYERFTETVPLLGAMLHVALSVCLFVSHRKQIQCWKHWSLNGPVTWRTATRLWANFQKLVSLSLTALLSWLFLHFWRDIFARQESTVRDDSICFCVGHIHLLGMCRCPAHPTCPGSMRVTWPSASSWKSIKKTNKKKNIYAPGRSWIPVIMKVSEIQVRHREKHPSTRPQAYSWQQASEDVFGLCEAARAPEENLHMMQLEQLELEPTTILVTDDAAEHGTRSPNFNKPIKAFFWFRRTAS